MQVRSGRTGPNFKVDTRHYGDLESLRTNVTYALSALAVSAVCFIIFTKLLEKRTIKAGYNAIRAISFVALVTLIFNLLRPATKLSVEQLKTQMLLNSCVNSVKGGKNYRFKGLLLRRRWKLFSKKSMYTV